MTGLVLSGHNLKAADITGKSDPYCKLQVNGAHFRTPRQEQTLEPLWNFPCLLPATTVNTGDGTIALYLEVRFEILRGIHCDPVLGLGSYRRS